MLTSVGSSGVGVVDGGVVAVAPGPSEGDPVAPLARRGYSSDLG